MKDRKLYWEPEESSERPTKTAEQQLGEMCETVEFGTPEYLAVSDAFLIDNLVSKYSERQKILAKDTYSEEKEDRIGHGWARIQEMQIAQRSTIIDTRKQELRGYAAAFEKTHDLLGDMFSEGLDQVDEKYFNSYIAEIQRRKYLLQKKLEEKSASSPTS